MSTNPVITRPRPHACWNKIGVRGDGSCPELVRHVHCRNCPVHAEAAALLLDSPASAQYLTQWTGHYAQPKPETDSDTLTFFIFRLGLEWLALPVHTLKEVAPLRPIHSLPHRRHGAIKGIINVRGELLLCLALDKVLGLEPSAQRPGKKRLEIQRLLVLKGEGGPLSFPVDEAHGIHSCSARKLLAVPSTVARAAAAYTHAVLSWNGCSVGCLDSKLLLTALNRSLA